MFTIWHHESGGASEERLRSGALARGLALKYEALQDGLRALGGTEQARTLFFDFQQRLYRAV